MEFNAEQLLFEAFSHIMHIFRSIEPQTESTFPFLYIKIFQTWESFEPPSSILGGDGHMPLWTFLYEIQCRTTFILIFF